MLASLYAYRYFEEHTATMLYLHHRIVEAAFHPEKDPQNEERKPELLFLFYE
jgi:hypothetical protein